MESINLSVPSPLSSDDLLLLLPHEVIAATIVLAMLSIAIRRHHFATTVLSTLGLLVAGLVAMGQFADQLVEPSARAITTLFLHDTFTVLFVVFICFSAMALAIIAYAYFSTLDDARDEFQLLLLLATLGAVTLASSNHFVAAVIGLELLSMAVYGMLAYPIHAIADSRQSLEATVKYLILSAVASATLLFGLALLYAVTGSLSFSAVAEAQNAIAIVGLTLAFAGVAFKLSLVPFHLWTPDVYEGAPMPAVAFLATLGKIAVAAFFLRLVASGQLLEQDFFVSLLGVVAAASVLAGNLLALRQSNLKRLLAYSSIAHMGYLFIALASGSAPLNSAHAYEVTTFYLLTYSCLALGAFGCASLVSCSEEEGSELTDYTGLFWRSPWLAVALSVFLLGLAGIPLTAGFIAKFQVFLAGVDAANWGLLASMVVGSVIGLYYTLRVIFQLLQPVDSQQHSHVLRVLGLESVGAVLVLAVLTVLMLWVGIYPEPILRLVATAIAVL